MGLQRKGKDKLEKSDLSQPTKGNKKSIKAKKRPDKNSRSLPQTLKKPNGNFSKKSLGLQMTVTNKYRLEKNKLNLD